MSMIPKLLTGKKKKDSFAMLVALKPRIFEQMDKKIDENGKSY